MEDSIQILGGSKASMPTLPEREPGWCKDTEELYMGTAGGNRKIADTKTFGRLDALEKKVAAAQADLPADATLAQAVAAHNALLAALRAAGILRT